MVTEERTGAEDPPCNMGSAKEALMGLISSDESSSMVCGSEVRDITLYQACARNEALTVRDILQRGVRHKEVMEVDINGRNGLMVAAYRGFVDIVSGLNSCPFLEINHQDKEGNTALMIAAQAGHVTILNHILNYYSGVDMEIRDARGFTALIKAAMQGRSHCVIALVMAGADVNAVDTTQGKNAREWALKTGRFKTLRMLQRLSIQPQALQFCENYVMEWPELKDLVAKTATARSRGKWLSQCLRSSFSFRFPQDLQDNGVLDHMVRMTTSIRSPLVVTGCLPLCPTGPPEVGKRSLAVSELAQQYSVMDLEGRSAKHSKNSISSISPTLTSSICIFLASCCTDTQRRGSMLSVASSTVQRSVGHHNSVLPAGCVPQIKVTKSRDPTPRNEKKSWKSRGYLEPPKWKYTEIKVEKKKEKKNDEMDKSEE